MPKTVSASEAKTRFGSIMSWAVEAQDEVIVESHGAPKVAIVPFQEYEKLLRLRQEARRREALSRLEKLAERVSKRNRDLSVEEAEALADRLTRETISALLGEKQRSDQDR